MATQTDSSLNTQIALNNEKFTHLLSLRSILQKKSFADVEKFCKNDLLITFDNNHILLMNILFHGMHKMLYNIDIKMINQFRNKITSNKPTKINDDTKEDTDIENDTNSTTPISFYEIPFDVIKFCISKYLDISTLISLEKVSKLYLSRLRNTSISSFHFNLTKFFSYKNLSYDLLRFKNTKKLSIVVEDDSNYGTRILNDYIGNYNAYTSQFDNHDPNNDILTMQLNHFKNQNEWSNWSYNSADRIIKHTKDKFDLILSQFKQYKNLQHLKLHGKKCYGYSETIIANTFIQYLPTLQSLQHLKVLELINISPQFTFVNSNMNSIIELRLTRVYCTLNSFQIMNDYMPNLESIYLSEVSINILNEQNVNNITVNNILCTLKHLIFDNPYSTKMISELFIKGAIFEDRFADLDNFYAIPCRKNVKVLHCHSHNADEIIYQNPIFIYPNLTHLCIGHLYHLFI